MAEFYLNLGESTLKEEPNKQSKWNYDCAYNLWVLENKTSPEYFKRIIAQIKNQQASLPHASAFNQTDAMKFALAHQNPLVSEMIKGGNELDEKQYSFLKTDNKDLLLWALKPAEDGGVAARFWNMGTTNEAKIDLIKKPKIVNSATHVETILNELPLINNGVNLKTNQQQMKTILIGY